jgi:branched-chain amino acid transport system permease protein
MSYIIFSIGVIVMYIAMATVLHLQFGVTGIVNFGFVGFWGLGMYGFGVLLLQYNVPFILALIIATAVTGGVAWLLGKLILDLDAQSVLVATLAFATIVQHLVTTEKWLTKGVVGLGSVPFPFDLGRYSDIGHLAILLLITGGLIWYAYRLEASPYGRLLTSIQDNEVLSRGLGKFTTKEKLRFFTATSAVIGLLGALNASAVHFLVPRMISPGVTFTVWIALVLGGRKRVLGGMIGVLATVGIFDFLVETFVPITPQAAQLIPVTKLFLYGLALVLILLFRPAGILGLRRASRTE